ncbi:hypothetical protein BGZ52_012388 [Haplosporangium bisporale]|nr:hypothetical protein BGZ52_012388 [Haplosporangium bisporale]
MTEDGASPQPSTTVAAAAAAPETSTLAVKLSDGPDADKDHHDQKRFRSYEEGMNPEYGDPNNDHRDSHYPNRRLRSQDETQNDARPKYSETRSGRFSDSSDREQDHTRYSAREQEKQYLRQGNGGDMREGSQDQERNSQGTDEDRDNMDDDGYGDDGDDNEESESMDTNSSKNDDGSDPLIVSMYGSPSLVKVRSMFIDKLFKMVEDPAIQHLIAWAKEGDMFYVFNCIELSTSVLPKFFKHNNWQSFVRQLNMYGFHKKESNMNRRNPETQRWQFYHPDFQRDQPHLRSNIKRKSARSINMVPTYSRVVFEPDKGYFMQQDGGPGPYVPGGPGGRFRVHSTGTAHSPNRGLLGMPPTVPSPQGFVPRPSYPIHKPSGPKDYRDDDHMVSLDGEKGGVFFKSMVLTSLPLSLVGILAPSHTNADHTNSHHITTATVNHHITDPDINGNTRIPAPLTTPRLTTMPKVFIMDQNLSALLLVLHMRMITVIQDLLRSKAMQDQDMPLMMAQDPSDLLMAMR